VRRALAAAVLAALWLISGLAHTSAGNDGGWRIASYRAQIEIHADASMTVVERIDADFGSLRKHGIIRDIPIEYDYEGEGNRLYKLDVRRVVDSDGTPWQYDVSRDGGVASIKVGDPDVEVSGRQLFEVEYTVEGALNSFPDHDELYWNVTGGDWDVPIDEASAVVSMPGGGITQVACFEGPLGSTDPCNHVSDDDGAGFVATQHLGVGQELTIVTALRKGAVAEPPLFFTEPEPNALERFFNYSAGRIALAALALFVGLGYVAIRYFRHGRDRVYRTMYYLTNDPTERVKPLFYRDNVVVEYTPPDEMTPAETGLILDEEIDVKDITATIVQMAVDGHLQITELPGKGFFGKDDWQLTRMKDPKSLPPFERDVFKAVMGEYDNIQLSKEYDHQERGTLYKAAQHLYADATRKRKWFDGQPQKARSSFTDAGWLFVIGGVMTGVFGATNGLGLVAVAIGLVGGVMLLSGRAMSKRTAKGSEALRRVLGYRLYIDTAESRRAEFYEKANIFVEVLPYAIVFGLVEKWAKVFEDLDMAPYVQWYRSSSGAAFDHLAAMRFSSSLQGFSSGISTQLAAVASTPGGRGLSGFSGMGGGGFSGGGGGGFSGGGGGGGGGRSW
jgi:uncharacterized membrane protein YgcG